MIDKEVLRVGMTANGFIVECYDQSIADANNKPRKGDAYDYKEPWKQYVFKDLKELSEFLEGKLKTLKPRPDAEKEFADSFKEFSKGDD